eukprot:12896109-Prorocentrum_lima.AAC.1
MTGSSSATHQTSAFLSTQEPLKDVLTQNPQNVTSAKEKSLPNTPVTASRQTSKAKSLARASRQLTSHSPTSQEAASSNYNPNGLLG